jgi:hypothetical protein
MAWLADGHVQVARVAWLADGHLRKESYAVTLYARLIGA